jgi:hypothetical protein
MTEKTGVLAELTRPIVGAAIEVHRALGPGLMESAYEECLCHELYILSVHEAQLLTYMKLLNKRVGLLLNSNVPVLKDGVRRRVL